MSPRRQRGGTGRWVTAVLVCLLVACQSSGHAMSPARPATSLREIWRWDAPPPAYVGMPSADGEGVAFTSALSRLVLLDGGGHVRWTAHEAGLRDVAPRLMAQEVVAATQHGLAAFSRTTGALTWTADFGERVNTPVVAGASLVASTWDGSLVAVDSASGAVRWRSSLPGAALGPATTDGRVVVVTWVADDQSAAGAVAVEADTGRTRWTVPLAPGGVSAPAVSTVGKGVVVVAAGDLAAHGLDLETGKELWRTGLEGAGSPEVPPLALANGDVLVAHRLGGLALLSGAGAPRWAVGSDGASVRGGPVGPGPAGRFALPLDDGRLLLTGPGALASVLDPPGRISGVAVGPQAALLVGGREATQNALIASTGW
jgi:outer membrane protein assembly factor BamB